MKRNKSIKNLLCVLLCLTAVVLLPGVKGEAAKKSAKPACAKTYTIYLRKGVYKSSKKKKTTTYYEVAEPGNQIFIKNLPAGQTNKKIIKNIKCSNPGIGVTYGWQGLKIDGYLCNPDKLKPGTRAKLSFKVKQKGKTYKLSTTLVFKKEPRLFQEFRVGGKNYASKASLCDVYEDAYIKCPSKAEKLTVKMRAGLEVKEIEITRWEPEYEVITVENGAVVELQKGDEICVRYALTKKPSKYLKGDAYKTWEYYQTIEVR